MSSEEQSAGPSNAGKKNTASKMEEVLNFEFVVNDMQRPTQIRKHAMRASWKERKQQMQTSVRKPTSAARFLAPKSPSPVSNLNKDRGRQSNDKNDKLLVARGPTNTQPIAEAPDTRSSSRESSPTTMFGSGALHGLSSLKFKVGQGDIELMKHWTSTYPMMIYGDTLESEIARTHIDLWMELEFSNEASFHGVLAYSAAHLAYLRSEPTPALAIIHNQEAIRIINHWLQDPVMMISDAAIAAVLRQTSLENWWGNEESIKIHRQGLLRMIELRGGLLSLRSNWRLEKAVFAINLVKEPYWFSPARHQANLDIENTTIAHKPISAIIEIDTQTFKQRCYDFVAFFNSLSSLQLRDTPPIGINRDGKHLALSRAISALNTYARYPFTANNSFSPHTYIEETLRVVTILYIAVLWRDSMLSGNTEDMDELNAALEAKEPHWARSIETLFNIALCGTDFPIIHPLKSIHVLQLMDVVRLLDLSSWTRLKVALFEAFAGNPADQLPAFRWDAELLFEELRDRF